MKKLLILVFVLALLVGGCAGLQKVQTTLCNPPAEVVAVAKSALPVLETIIGMLVPGTAPFMAAAQSINVVDTITSGGCVAVTQLNDLIALLQSKDAKAAQDKMKTGKKMAAAPVKIQVLENWRDGKLK